MSGEQWLQSLIPSTGLLNNQFLRVTVTECLLHCGRTVITAIGLYPLADLLSATDLESRLPIKIMWGFRLLVFFFLVVFSFKLYAFLKYCNL